MNLSFAGCGFLGIYHVGVAVCFKKYAPHLLLDKISGASVGALASTCLLCDMPLGEMTSDFFRIVNEARSHSLGPFSPSFNIQTCLLEGLQKFLPANAHELVSGRLHISLTRVYDGKNVIVSKFNSREEVLQALLCACFIPGFSGLLPPRFQGVRYMDGAFSDNLPVLDENTITVSPFCGESDICPRDETAQLYHVNWANTSIELSRQNIHRFGRILFPPKPEVLSNMCQQGFDDALSFLHRNDLISCTRCLAVQSTFDVQENVQDSLRETGQEDYDPECKECIKHRKEALIDNMPETVLTVFQTYIESANKGLANWIFKHRGAKLLKTLSLPATLPADIVCATLTNYVGDSVERREFRFMVLANIVKSSKKLRKFCTHDTLVAGNFNRILAATPCIKDRIHTLIKYIMSQIDLILSHKKRQKMTANISCQLSLTEFGNVPKSKHLSHRSSKVDVLFNENEISTTIDNDKYHTPYISALDKHHDFGTVDFDTFDHILTVTSEHDAVYAYYYMDENNKVKVTEIFDMTDSDSPEMQSLHEREINQQLQFDAELDLTEPDFLWGEHHRQNTMIDIEDEDEFYKSISETLLEIEEMGGSNNSSEIFT
ncbi:1-acylglycerol-3-phosphate O-acyltransferase Pnpla3-like isoform X2 [Bradysia coprophila]|uniref:1-acylglycerol-3-phosphate O-acyltransferase Pnpla3-like isoform X2 n=1 Tax=Bradysia coprophila TaxID=38358 RepID=UPI00187DD915|nr:1-acylglycerol-3-phosphate O-acyltransferase Pnpla3-like isoform X2 [Bradysia coprophila]